MADHNTLSGGVAGEIEGGTVLIGGVACEIQSGMTLVNGVAREITFAPPTIEPAFADNTWEAIVYACQNNIVPSSWKVADSKILTVNGADYQIDIIGRSHDYYADNSGTAPLTFQFNKCYGGKGYTMVSGIYDFNPWETCKMRETYLPQIKQALPAVIRNAIRPVSKRTAVSGTDPTIKTNSEELFLLAELEIFGVITSSQGNEGSQYEYYAAGGSTDKDLNGAENGWWERSIHKGDIISSSFGCVKEGTAGGLFGMNAAGVAPAFCF